eukprot:Phypoly_transcript_26007.p1 GENE.Phypoly_transcript_26007~~Phypoly_transcript_26007.p1  ORF type:complete len:102 (+),score=17.82 Phypoly_transcript_26007:66-371(+)
MGGGREIWRGWGKAHGKLSFINGEDRPVANEVVASFDKPKASVGTAALVVGSGHATAQKKEGIKEIKGKDGRRKRFGEDGGRRTENSRLSTGRIGTLQIGS